MPSSVERTPVAFYWLPTQDELNSSEKKQHALGRVVVRRISLDESPEEVFNLKLVISCSSIVALSIEQTLATISVPYEKFQIDAASFVVKEGKDYVTITSFVKELIEETKVEVCDYAKAFYIANRENLELTRTFILKQVEKLHCGIESQQSACCIS